MAVANQLREPRPTEDIQRVVRQVGNPSPRSTAAAVIGQLLAPTKQGTEPLTWTELSGVAVILNEVVKAPRC